MERNYKAFDYSKYLKTKYIYGIIDVEKEIEVVGKNELNQIFILSNKVKNNIEKNLEEILGGNSEIVKRNITSEILRR